MGMFEYVKIKEAIGKVQDAVGKIYDDIKAIPKTSGGAMKAGAFREEAISLGSAEKDITNCVFSVEGKGKLHAAWLAPIEPTQVTTSYRWGLKVVIDDEIVFDVQKKPGAEGYYESLGSVGFITASIYSSGIENVYSDTSGVTTYRGMKLIPFKETIGYNMGRKNFAPFILFGYPNSAGQELGYSSSVVVGEFVNGVGNSDNGTSTVVLPKVPVTSYYLASGGPSRFISATSIIPEPIIFDKSVKVYASYKHNSGSYLAARIAYTLE